MSSHKRDRQWPLPSLIAAILVAAVLPTTALAQEYRSHVVKQGDTLYRIARQNLVTVQSLRTLNEIKDDHIEPGQVIWIDGRPEPDSSLAQVDVAAADSLEQVNQVPDSLDDVANVAAEADSEVADDSTASVGIVLPDDTAMASDADTVETEMQYHGHLVERGETFFDIAARYNVSVEDVAEANPDHATYLAMGDTVNVPWVNQFGTHKVTSGETLFRISRRYGTTVARIQELNDLTGTAINVGQSLIVPVTPDNGAEVVQTGPELLDRGAVSVYPEMFEGRLMANGRAYMPEKYTVSHSSIDLGTLIRIVEPESGRAAVAEVTDRLPSGSEVIMEISEALALVLRLEEPATEVEVHRLN